MKNIINSIKLLFNISRLYLFLVALSSILNSLVQIILLYSIKIIIDSIQIGNIDFLYKIIILLFIISLILPFSNAYFSNKTLPILNNKIDEILKKIVYKKYLKINLDYFLNTKNYNLYFYTLENINIIKEISTSLSNLLNNILSVIGISSLFIAYDIKLVVIIVIGSFMTFIASITKEKIIFNLEIINVDEMRILDYINRLFYLLDYSKEIRNNYTEKIFYKYKNAYKSINKNILTFSNKLILIDFLVGFLKINTFILIIFIVGTGVIEKKITVGTFSMIMAGCLEMHSLLENLLMSIPNIYSMSLKTGKIEQFFNVKNSFIAQNLSEKITKIRTKNLYFSYDQDSNNYILKNINITIDEHDNKIAILGENGSGKSTLLSIISGLYSPSKGNIFYNDLDNINYSLDFKKHFYVIFQDYKFFSMSIKDNLILKIPKDKLIEDSYIDKKIFDALKIVGLFDKILQLQNGINTVLTKEFDNSGENLSQGELQRLAIAKAYLSDSEILILDEPFSFGDYEYKKEIFNILNTLSKDKKIIVVTHDQDNIEFYDKVFKITNGYISQL